MAEPILQKIISDILDRRRMSAGVTACQGRKSDFTSAMEMQLAGIAMVPEARQLVSDRLTEYWASRRISNDLYIGRSAGSNSCELVVGAGLHAAIYAAARVAMGYPKPIVLERSDTPGGAFAVSLNPVFRLNSRNRPGTVGLPDQDKALNYIPGALLQPSMMTSQEYPDNADMAWLIRLTLAQFADVYTSVNVASVATSGNNDFVADTEEGAIRCTRVIDARGIGDPVAKPSSPWMLTFQQFMKRMGGMFPLRGMRQVAVIGGGDSGKCAAESLLGVAPGNSSAIGLDYVNRVDWYTGGPISDSCDGFRFNQRGRYIRLSQYLEGNVSNPTARLKIISGKGYATPLPDGALVNDRTYDMAIMCTGAKQENLDTSGLGYFNVVSEGRGTVLAKSAAPYEIYKIGPAANIPFSEAEDEAGITANRANRVAMFRLAQRTAALGAMLPNVRR